MRKIVAHLSQSCKQLSDKCMQIPLCNAHFSCVTEELGIAKIVLCPCEWKYQEQTSHLFWGTTGLTEKVSSDMVWGHSGIF